MPSQGVLARGSLSGPDRTHGRELPSPELVPHPSTPSHPGGLQSFVTASFEMHMFLIGNVLIVPLICFKLYEK